jgi:pyruvate formate lyase activating enzyme
MVPARIDRRKAIKRGVMGVCGLALGARVLSDLALKGAGNQRPGMGFPLDAPSELGPWAREAAWSEVREGMVHCQLCPHQCVLAEADRGPCRARAVKGGRLYTLVYGNPCAVHLDPMEKKPFYHFLPGAPVLSIATAGCNLHCVNCQNWEISQSKPEETRNTDMPPARLVEYAKQQGIPAIAYTYSEPIIFYEYVRDTAALARENQIRNVLVTAGYILEKPLRELCRVVDAATVDLKGFSDRLYRKITGATLKPVLRALEVMREEGVWVELTRLIVPTLTDDMDEVKSMCAWLVRTLGPSTPLSFLRFHPAYRLQGLPPTPAEVLAQARQIALSAGLHYVFVGNVPGHEAQNTICPRCGLQVISRRGFQVLDNRLNHGRCPCGELIPGVWL